MNECIYNKMADINWLMNVYNEMADINWLMNVYITKWRI